MKPDDQIQFSETQRFSYWWVWLILAVANGILVFGIVEQVVLGRPFGNKPMGNALLLLLEALIFVVSICVLSLRLDTQITNEGVCVRFFPFRTTFRLYRWDTITKCYIRQYHPIADYGGWGIRFGIFGNGRALTVSGNKGLQLEFADNSKLLIGTKQATQLSEVLSKINRFKG